MAQSRAYRNSPSQPSMAFPNAPAEYRSGWPRPIEGTLLAAEVRSRGLLLDPLPETPLCKFRPTSGCRPGEDFRECCAPAIQ